MDQATHNKIVSFIWAIADDVLRDLFKRGKYPDVILPMAVIRRMDAVLEPTKAKVLETKTMLDDAGITEQRAALCAASGQAFYNTSKFKLRDLKWRGSQQQLLADFEDYLNGFSPNVQDILDNLGKAPASGRVIVRRADATAALGSARTAGGHPGASRAQGRCSSNRVRSNQIRHAGTQHTNAALPQPASIILISQVLIREHAQHVYSSNGVRRLRFRFFLEGIETFNGVPGANSFVFTVARDSHHSAIRAFFSGSWLF